MNDRILGLLLNEEITNVVQCSIGYIQKDLCVQTNCKGRR